MGRLSAERLALVAAIYDPEENYHETRAKWFGLDITHSDGRRETVDAADATNQPDDLVD